MNRIIIAIILIVGISGCNGTKSSYVTKDEGMAITEKLREIHTTTIELVKKSNEHSQSINEHDQNIKEHDRNFDALEKIITRLHPQAVSTLSNAEVRNVLSTRAVDIPRSDSAGFAANTGTTRTLVPPLNGDGTPIYVSPCELAVKFGEFKNGTELRLATIDESQTKQDEKLGGHDTAIGELTKSLGKLTEKVDGFTQGLDQLKLEVQGMKTTPPPTPEAQPKPPS